MADEMHWMDVMGAADDYVPAATARGASTSSALGLGTQGAGGTRRPPKVGLEAFGIVVPKAAPSGASGSASVGGVKRRAEDDDVVIVPCAPRVPLVPTQAPTFAQLAAMQAEEEAAAAAVKAKRSGGGRPRVLSLSALRRQARAQEKALERAARAAARPTGAAPLPEDDESADEVEECSESDSGASEGEDEDAALPPLELPLPDLPAGHTLQPGAEALRVPGDMASKLKPFQVDGVRFLHRRFCLAAGCVLGDDMGLGKTLQTIAFLAAVMRKQGRRADARPGGRVGAQALVAVPKSLLDNWVRELDKWGSFKVRKAYGKQFEPALEAIRDGSAEICLTTHNVYERKCDDFVDIAWTVVVFDEAHKIQNHSTRGYKAAMRAPHSAFRIALTGTIMSNAFMELHSLLDLAVPGCLGDRPNFMATYERPITRGRAANSTQRELADYAQRCEQLHRIVKTHVMARDKKDPLIAAQLPTLGKKKDKIVFCEMSAVQQRAYDRMIASEDFQLLGRAFELCDCGSGEQRAKCCHATCNGPFYTAYNARGSEWCRQTTRQGCPYCCILPFMTLAQKVANHLELIKADPNEKDLFKRDRESRMAQAIMGEDGDKFGVWASSRWEDLATAEQCGKLKALEYLLHTWSTQRPEVDEGNKVLIFSYSVRLLNILEHFLLARHYTFLRLDGSTPQAARSTLVDSYNNDTGIFIFLISTKAGGVGLNLTAANRVVVFDPSWNPAHDLQAQDRAYRLGQKRDVHVYRLIAAHTLEEQTYLRQVAKQHTSAVGVHGTNERRLFTGVANDRRRQGELYGLANLFKPRDGELRTAQIRAREAAVAAAVEAAAVEEEEEEEGAMKWDANRVNEEGAGGAAALAAAGVRHGGEPPADDDDADDPAGLLLRTAAIQQAAALRDEDEDDNGDDDDDGAQSALAAAGVVKYDVDHGSMLGPGAVEARIVAVAKATIRHVDVPAPPRALPPRRPAPPAPAAPPARGLRIGQAPEAPASEEALVMMAAQWGMSVPDLAQQLLSMDHVERKNQVDVFLRAKGAR